MSRGFGPTFGVGSTDVVVSSYATGTSSKISFACWYYKNGTGGAGAGRPIDCSGNTNDNWYLKINSSTTSILFDPANNTFGNAFWTDMGTGVWQHLCLTYDNTTATNAPVVYVNGVAVNVSSSINVIMTAGIHSVVIGNSSVANRNWDGMIAHAAYWNGTILSASEASALAAGVNPLLIRPEGLSLYLPLDGVNNPEIDLINGNTSSITGTRLGTSEPPVMPLARYREGFNYEAMPASPLIGPLLTGVKFGSTAVRNWR